MAFIRKGLPFFVSLPTDDGIVVASGLGRIGEFETKVRVLRGAQADAKRLLSI